MMTEKPIHILVVEGNTLQAEMCQNLLRNATKVKFTTECVATLKDCQNRLQKDGIDLILIDLNLPDSQGLATLEVLNDSTKALPIIVLSATQDEHLAVEAVRLGAQDYILKEDLENLMLSRSIQYAIERKKLDLIRTEFVRAITHEIRSPLTIIKSAIDNLVDGLAGPLKPEQEKILNFAKENTDRLARIVKETFTFQLIESKRHISKEPVDFVVFVKRVVSKFQDVAKPKKIMINQKFSQPCPTIRLNPLLLESVFNHLLDNALRYAQEKVTIQIDKKTDGNQKNIHVSIIDDGPGLSDDKIARLFQIFSQINRPQGGAGYQGIGLGLAACKEIIKHHHGKIWAEPGEKGLILNFTLPIDHPFSKRSSP